MVGEPKTTEYEPTSGEVKSMSYKVVATARSWAQNREIKTHAAARSIGTASLAFILLFLKVLVNTWRPPSQALLPIRATCITGK